MSLKWQFTSSRHRQNLHSGRRILQSDRVPIGRDRRMPHSPHSGTIPGSESVRNCPFDTTQIQVGIRIQFCTGGEAHRSIELQPTCVYIFVSIGATWHMSGTHLDTQSDIQVVHRYPHSGLESVVESASPEFQCACLWSNSEYQSHPISCTFMSSIWQPLWVWPYTPSSLSGSTSNSDPAPISRDSHTPGTHLRHHTG